MHLTFYCVIIYKHGNTIVETVGDRWIGIQRLDERPYVAIYLNI